MDGFPFVYAATVRFSDLDCRGHVNNAVFSSFIEDARLRWYEETGDPDEAPPMSHDIDMILARTEIDFRGELRTVGESVEVGVRLGRVGPRSLDLEYRLHAGDRVVAEARSVLVGFDFVRGVSAPIPERWRHRVQRARESAVTVAAE